MTHKVAIIKGESLYNNYDDYTKVITSISDWADVTEEDFKLLKDASYRLGFSVIEQPLEPIEFIATTVAEQIEYVKKEKAKEVAEKARRAQLALEKKHKKELKDKESKIALLRKLQEELGDSI